MAEYTEEEKKRILEDETEKLKQKERENLIIDFDEALEEENADSIVVKFRGDEYEMPPNAPAWLPLFINKHMNGSGVVEDKHNLELIARLLGDEFANKIIESGNDVSFEAVNNRILQPVMEHWGLSVQDDSGNEKTRS